MNPHKQKFLDRIGSNIKTFGYHLTTVAGNSPLPRYVYSIGLTEKIGFELIFAGDGLYNIDELKIIIERIVIECETLNLENIEYKVALSEANSLINVDNSWSQLMMLGVYDFYNVTEFKAMQIIPDSEHLTLDIPNMAKEYNENEPIWKWLTVEWTLSVPSGSIVITNYSTLLGEKITEATRWEEDEWEAFVGESEDMKKEDMRIMPLGVLIGIDSSTMTFANLKIGKGIYREETDLVWQAWN